MITNTDNGMANNPQRQTRQRQVILEELAKVNSHPTADEVYNLVRKRLPKISLGTVYRNLELLANSGQIRKLDWSGSQKRFDGQTFEHYHMHCTKCRKVYDVPLKPIAALAKALKKIKGYEISSYHLEFSGLCPNCNK